MQPCRGQSKTGSIHIFIEQALASPLPPELLPPKRPPSGRTNPPDEDDDEDEEEEDDEDEVPVSSCTEASSPGGVPLSSPGAHAAPQPLLLVYPPDEPDEPLLPLDPPDPPEPLEPLEPPSVNPCNPWRTLDEQAARTPHSPNTTPNATVCFTEGS